MSKHMLRRDFLKQAGCMSLMAMGLTKLSWAEGEKPDKPDMVLFVADDMTWHDCEPYGSTVVKTPNMAKLAREGMCFDAMFTSTAMCAPTRQQLYTGLFPVRSGAWPNHSRVYDGVKSLAHHLKSLGYRVGLKGKRHYGPEASFPFEYFGGRHHDNGSGLDLDIRKVESFIQRDPTQPYCLIIATNQPHSPWNRTIESVSYDPDAIQVPPYLVDTPETRRLLCQYYHEITYADQQLGQCMEVVERLGRPDKTIVVFTSEQGSDFPFGGKWTCYDTGLKTAFIVRWPGKVKPNTRNAAMTQYVDVVPTFIEAAGGDPSNFNPGRPDALGGTGFDGRSLMQVLQGKTHRFRNYVYGVQTSKGIHNGPEAYPIRSVRSERYKYIWNPNWQARFTNMATRGEPISSWRKRAEADEDIAARVRFYQHRPEEELYDLQNDPWELDNLASDEKLTSVKAQLREQLLAWMTQQGDEGTATEMLALSRLRDNT